MSSVETGAVEMRQSPTDDALVDVLQRLRPWRDSAPMTAALRLWANRRGWHDVDVQQVGIALVEPVQLQQVLDRLPEEQRPAVRRQWYAELDDPTDAEMAGMAAYMIRNVVAGRRVTNYGMDGIQGISADARAGYLRRYGNRATFAWLERMEYGQLVHRLTLHGVKAPRRWIQRNPGAWPTCSVSARTAAPPWRLMSARYRCRTLAEYNERHRLPDDSPAPDPAHRRP